MQGDFFSGTQVALSGQISLDDVFEAYYECRRSKRRTANALAFEADFEQQLVRLWREINSGTYKIGRSIAFIVKDPVQREVFAADFRDRVVHHLVISRLNPLFEEEFIDNSYSCRAGKGVLYGVQSIQKQITECSDSGRRDCYVMKLDIRSFFMSINKNILYRMLFEFVSDRYHKEDKHILLRLIKLIIYNNPEDNCVIKGGRESWNGLPCHKSLFWTERFCGLPIGNLTSQIFANFYLNSLDKYVTEELKIKYYGRYVDDFVLIHTDKQTLLDAREKISEFLRTRLKLTLHPQKFYLQHYSKGVKFIGAVIKPNRIYTGSRSKGNLYRKIHQMLPLMAHCVENVLNMLPGFVARVNSYLGYMRHYNTYNLRSVILQRLDKTFLGEISELRPHADKFAVNKEFLPHGLEKRRLSRQRRYRRAKRKKQLKGLKNGNV